MDNQISITNRNGHVSITVTSEYGHSALPALWLRERAETPCQVDQVTGQRLFNAHSIDPDLSIISAKSDNHHHTVTIQFSDGYCGIFKQEALLNNVISTQLLPSAKPWDATLDPLPRLDWQKMDDPAARFRALHSYLENGFLLIANTPVTPDSFEDIVRHFGFIKETAHGRSFEVRTKPVYNDLGYQPVALAPHTDMPYSNPMPGAQILQCHVNETSGGLSTLVDALTCCNLLRDQDSAAYELLAKTPVRFVFNDPAEAIWLDCPMLDIDDNGTLLGVRYSPRLDYMPLMGEATTRAYHRARRKLGALFNDPAFEIRFRLDAGDMVLFDNSRILHGRTAFDPNEGLRHLQGCYIDRDGPSIHYQTLKRDHGFG